MEATVIEALAPLLPRGTAKHGYPVNPEDMQEGDLKFSSGDTIVLLDLADEEWARALAAWERLEREVDAQAKQEAPTLGLEPSGGDDDSLERQLEAELDAHMQLPLLRRCVREQECIVQAPTRKRCLRRGSSS